MLRRPRFPGVDRGLVLAGDGAFDGLGDLLRTRATIRPSSGVHRWAAPAVHSLAGRVRAVGVRLWPWRLFPWCRGYRRTMSRIWHRSASSRCRSAAICRSEGPGAGRAGFVVLRFGVCGLLQCVGFGLRGEPQLSCLRPAGRGLGAFTVEDPRFELATVQAADDVGFVAYLQRSNSAFRMVLEFGVAAVRLAARRPVRGSVIPAASR